MAQRRERLTIVGAGMASVRLCEEIAARCPDRYAVTVLGAETRPGYNRVLLSSYLAGDIDDAGLTLRDRDWYAARGMTLHTGTTVARLSGLACDRLVLATGSEPIRLPLPGADLPGVLTFRDADDVGAIRAVAGAGARVVVIGCGLLGLEAAYGLAKAGVDVTVLHLMDRLMERQIDARGARFLQRALERKGIRFRLGASTQAFLGHDRVDGVRLADGEIIACAAIVVAIGIRPRVELARDHGIAVNRGIVVNDALETSAANVFAIGECAEHRGQVYGLVEPAYEQAAVLARRLSGENATYAGTTLSTNLKVSGVGVFSAGDFMGVAGGDSIVYEEADAGTYRKLVVRESRLTGAILVGDTGDALWYRDLIRRGASIAAARRDLIFGPDYCTPLRDAA